MAINVYDIGDVVTVTASFTSGGAAVDPSTVSVQVNPPSGTVVQYDYPSAQVSKTSTGNYSATISVTEAGYWYYRWVSTGTGQAGEEGQFVVKPRSVPEPA